MGVQRGLEMRDLRDLKDSTIHDVQPASDEQAQDVEEEGAL